MPLDWPGMFKRYVADDIKTPYFVPVARLTRVQANNELFVYTLFLAVLFGVIGVASLSPSLPHGNALGVPIYAFMIAGSAVAFGLTKHPAAAGLCVSAPVGVLIYFTLYGFHPNATTSDKVLQVIIVLLWMRYSWRIIKIARAYRNMSDRDPLSETNNKRRGDEPPRERSISRSLLRGAVAALPHVARSFRWHAIGFLAVNACTMLANAVLGT